MHTVGSTPELKSPCTVLRLPCVIYARRRALMEKSLLVVAVCAMRAKQTTSIEIEPVVGNYEWLLPKI